MGNEVTILKTLDGQAMPLTGVNAKGVLVGDLFELEVEQRYRNSGKKNIEAIYTFPLPPGAVLMGLTVELNGKTLSGVAVERKAAERQYEDAIDEGDTAILLERSQEGLYTVNLGNLLAGEEAVIRYRYAEPLAWEQGRLRLAIPTAVAPRYGDALAGGLQPHQVPEADLGVAYPLSLSIDILGNFARDAVSSPSHGLVTATIDNGFRVSPVNGWLDRDFVLLVAAVGHSRASVGRDGGGWVAMAAFCPEMPETGVDLPLSLRLVIDCSGSMGGDSIRAARQGALKVVESLKNGDEFNVTLFGSQHQHVFGRLQPAGRDQAIEAARHLLGLEANMGGTEMESALRSACALESRQQGGCLLLITDGEIWGVDSLIASARASGLRFFVVGVGSSPSHATLRRLADETGGSYEAVSPNEDIEAAILRLFARMRQPRARNLSLVWDQHPGWQVPLPKALFKGDTLHAFAGCSQAPSGHVRLRYKLDDGTVREERASVMPWTGRDETLARLAAARRIDASAMAREDLGESALSNRQMTDLAVQHNLVTEFTHYLVVHERAEAQKAAGLPETVRVKQMLAAGWGGAGTVMECRTTGPAYSASVSRKVAAGDVLRSLGQDATRPMKEVMCYERQPSLLDLGDSIEHRDVPVFPRSKAGGDEQLTAWVRRMAARVQAGNLLEEEAYDELLGLLAPEASEVLEEIAALEGFEAAIRVFLVVYARSSLGEGLPRHLRRELRHLEGRDGESPALYRRLGDAIRQQFDTSLPA